MSIENQLLVTAHPEFSYAAVAELKQLDKQVVSSEEVSPGIILCSSTDSTALMDRAAKQPPTFARHLAPVQAIVELTDQETDIGKLAMTIAQLPGFSQLEPGVRFAVQSRFAQVEKGRRPYTSGQLNQALAEAFAEETRAIESIKKPQIVISILCDAHQAYIGISTTEENLSSWPGGARHFAQTSEQISRAEFKLLEALDVFGVTLPTRGTALDLGAAPGGWTRLLLEAGMRVEAVDPANLDARLARHPHLEHYRGYAEQYLEEANRKQYRFDVIANDMRMDAREAARLLVTAASCLRKEGFVISVFKLPHATTAINPLANLREAMSILNKRYSILQARQLFHNRQEVTVIAAQPLPTRA